MSIIPTEGWHVLNLFYSVNFMAWQELEVTEQLSVQMRFMNLIDEIRNTPDTQLIFQQMISSKADLGILLITPDLLKAAKWEKQIVRTLGSNVLEPSYSYFSITEKSEYIPKRADFINSVLINERNLSPDSQEFCHAITQFDASIEAYTKQNLYPVLPNWEVMCFYPISQKRDGEDNWYRLNFDQRAELMLQHFEIGKKYNQKVLQMISGSTGLDEYEWGVNLLAHSPEDIKSIIYEMKFDEISARYSIFGDFFIGLILPPEEILTHILG